MNRKNIMSDSWFEVAFGAHYPVIYAHRDEAEARACFELLPKLASLGNGQKPVLDLGCGDGRHLQALAQNEIPAVGLDLSASLLEKAAQRQACPPLVRSDMRWLPFASRSFSSVLSLFTAFGYFGALADNGPVVAEIARVLAPGGHWFFDYFNCDRVRSELGSGEDFVRERKIDGLRVTETRRFFPDESVVRKRVELQGRSHLFDLPEKGLEYTEKVAVFSLEQMDEIAQAHGLKRVASAGSYFGDELGNGDRWLLVYCR